MKRPLESVLAGIAAILLVGTALFHHSGFSYVSGLATTAGPELQPLVPALWLSFSVGLVVLGLIAGAIALRPAGRSHRAILSFIALYPAATAVLQVYYIGFVLPTAVLLLDAVVAGAAAVAAGAAAAGRGGSGRQG